MGVNLTKSGNVSLTKAAPGLATVVLGLGWDARTTDGSAFDLDASALESLESERKQIQIRTQELQNLRTTRSKAIGQAKAKGEDVSALMAEVAGFGDELKTSETRLDAIRAEIEAIMESDPFFIGGVAEYEIIEFVPSMTAEALEAFRYSVDRN